MIYRVTETEERVEVAFYAVIGGGDGTKLDEMFCDAGYHATLEVKGELSLVRELYAFRYQPRHKPAMLVVGVLRCNEIADGISIPDIQSSGNQQWGGGLVVIEGGDGTLVVLLDGCQEFFKEGLGIAYFFAL